ncbi:hypothetical protein HYQ46_001791 [Verticillium longisporum]|nr:hypothetical protein HYQ46_001791 [Verticillium longisporum]
MTKCQTAKVTEASKARRRWLRQGAKRGWRHALGLMTATRDRGSLGIQNVMMRRQSRDFRLLALHIAIRCHLQVRS